MIKTKNLTAIDLFSGAGGLSYGLKQAGFDVIAGLEIDPAFAQTYTANHRNSKIIIKDIQEVTGRQIKKITGIKHLNLLAGCPPCQGFSSLTEKHKKEDPRNQLPLEMARLVTELKPDMVMMENVPGLTKKGKNILDIFVKKLEKDGYIVNYDVLQLADYGIPQTRRRFVLLAGKGFEIKIPKPTHSRKGHNGKKKWLTLKDAFKRIKKNPITLSKAKKEGIIKKHNWHIIRDIKSSTLAKLQATKEGESRYALPINLRPNCHKESNKGFGNVYGRLSWNETPGTITSGCTTLSMGRFGHPKQNRTISIREAATIQTFPQSFKFQTEFMDDAAIMVGNALPPKFAKLTAKIMAKKLHQQTITKN